MVPYPRTFTKRENLERRPADFSTLAETEFRQAFISLRVELYPKKWTETVRLRVLISANSLAEHFAGLFEIPRTYSFFDLSWI